MEKVILETIRKYNLFKTDAALIVAVSGGADSMMLLHILSKLQYKLVIAHVNHQKRVNGWLDQQLVTETAQNLGIPVHIYQLPPAPKGANFQAYARQKRYEFFLEVAKAHGSSHIVTAHHGDDHLETVIQRLLHHQSASGLQGIQPVTEYAGIKLSRPLLALSKQDIYDYCEQAGIFYREDRSNQSDAYSRNRIRQRIIPALSEESPRLLAHVRQLSDGIAEDEAYFSQEVKKLWLQIEATSERAVMSRKWLGNLPAPLAKRLVKDILQKFGIQDFSAEHLIEILHRVRNGNPNEDYYLPNGARFRLAYEKVEFLTNFPIVAPYHFDLALNSKVTLPNSGELVISYKKEGLKGLKSCINEVYLCYNERELPLRVRTRQNGDRLDLKGGGSKKIKEIMIEAKIPKHLRDSWPIITDANDRILWVPLLKKTAACQEAGTEEMIKMEYRHLGGS